VNTLNKKELLKLIKEKANQIEVKDFTEEIIIKAQSFKHESEYTPKPVFAFKPVMTMAILVLTLVFVSALAIPYLPKKPILFENFENAIAISSLTALNLAEQTYTSVSTQTLSFYDSSHVIDDEIGKLTTYMTFIEQLVLTEKLITSSHQIDRNRKKISFETTNMFSENQAYELSFTSQYSDRRNDVFKLGGVLVFNHEVFVIEAQTLIINGKHQLILKLIIDSVNYIIVRYEEDNNQFNYDVEVYTNDLLTQSLKLIYRAQANQKEVFVHFIKGKTIGSYRFTQNEDAIKAHYAILKNGTRETGNMMVHVFNHPSSNNAMYRFTIQPLGALPFVVERSRSKNPNLNHMMFENQIL
jgi:hypothetical protein